MPKWNSFGQHWLTSLTMSYNNFYSSSNIDEVMLSLPSTLTKKEIQLIHTQWPFFNIAYSYVVLNLPYSFPSCNIIKTAVQALYNSMKVGLDANLQQSLAILPPIKTGLCHMIYHHNSHKLMEGLATVGTTY